MPTVMRFYVKCYRCQAEGAGERDTEQEARAAVEQFKGEHTRKCGYGSSFMTSIAQCTYLNEGTLNLGAT